MEESQENTTTNEVPPQQPVVQQVAPVAINPAPVIDVSKKHRKKWLFPAIFVGALVIAGGAAAYQTVFNKSPEELFSSALDNTGDAFEKFLSIENRSKGVKINGSFDVSSPVSVDGSLSGQWYESNGSMTANVGAAGVRVNSEVRTIKQETSEVPDIYAKVSGLEGAGNLLSTFGNVDPSVGKAVEELNDQWYVIDHTLIEQSLLSGASGSTPELSDQEMNEIKQAVSGVVSERLFGSDDDKAVFKINEKIGKEEFEGTNTYKLNVGVNKENFVVFLESFEEVVKNTKLKDIIEMSSPGQSIDELLNFGSIGQELEDVNFDKAVADVWVEGGGRFIRNVRIYPNQDEKDKTFIDFMVPYEGGDIIPLVLRATLEDEEGKGTMSFGIDLNQENGDSRLWFDIDINAVGQVVAAKAELSVSGSDEQVSVDTPEDAKSALQLFSQLSQGVQSQFQALPPSDFDPSDFDSSQFDDLEIPAQNFQL